MSRILVTGGTGFIGRALVGRLRDDGRVFRAAVRRATDLPAEIVVIGPVGPDTDWQRALRGVDAVIHLAGRAHIVRHEPDALTAFRRVNRDGTARLTEQAAASGVRRFILISSVKAAADTSGSEPLTEADPPSPGTAYGISKLEGERAVRAVAETMEGCTMETVILRPPLVYGPEVGANFRALLRLVDSGLPLPLGSVANRRSLIARDNLVDAIVTALDSSGAAGGVFYVADGPPISTPQLVRMLAPALGRTPRLLPFPPALLAAAAKTLGRADAAHSLLGSLAVDDRAFRAATGWQPPIAQADALAKVAAWYRSAKGRP